MQQPCSICGKSASHKVVKIQSGQLEETYYCNEHAPGAKQLGAQTHLQVSLEDLLNSLLSQTQQMAQGGVAGPAGQATDIKCGVCGLPFFLYRKTMILGCDRCYESFAAQLEHDLRKFHGAVKHVGRRPENFIPNPTPAQAKPVIRESEAAAPVSSPSPSVPDGPSPQPAPEPIPKDESVPIGADDLRERLFRLRLEMRQAVEREDFEQAARLRDSINQLEKEWSGHAEEP